MIVANALRLPYGDLSAHAAVTSPPYYLKRRYEGVEPSPWPEVSYSPMPGLPPITVPEGPDLLGLEPDPFAYIAHLVLIFREVWRVLRDDGVLCVNIGDSYCTTAPGQTNADPMRASTLAGKGAARIARNQQFTKRYTPGYKPKDLMGIPWRLAFALVADGWTLRSRMPGGVEMRPDVIWTKNAMPESVRDRPSVDFEDVFIFSKARRYFWDQENGRVANTPDMLRRAAAGHTRGGQITSRDASRNDRESLMNGREITSNGANLRASWKINTEPTNEEHYAAWPRELVRRLIKIGTSDKGCCPECGAQWARVVEREPILLRPNSSSIRGSSASSFAAIGQPQQGSRSVATTDLGWAPGCSCEGLLKWSQDGERFTAPAPVPCRVLDPFSGIGRTGEVCFETGRVYMPAELSVGYAAIQARRLEERRPGLEVERLKAEAAAAGQVLGAGKLAEISGPLFAQEDS